MSYAISVLESLLILHASRRQGSTRADHSDETPSERSARLREKAATADAARNAMEAGLFKGGRAKRGKAKGKRARSAGSGDTEAGVGDEEEEEEEQELQAKRTKKDVQAGGHHATIAALIGAIGPAQGGLNPKGQQVLYQTLTTLEEELSGLEKTLQGTYDQAAQEKLSERIAYINKQIIKVRGQIDAIP
jgi:hypothetical protein